MEKWKERMKDYNNGMKERLEVANSKLPLNDINNWNQLSLSQLDEEFLDKLNKVISDETIPHADDDPTPDEYDSYINMELGMPRGPDGELKPATVKRRAIDIDGKPFIIVKALYGLKSSRAAFRAFLP